MEEDELRINLVLTLVFLSSSILLVAYQSNFFKVSEKIKSKVSIFQVLGSFLAFLFAPVFLAPILIASYHWSGGSEPFNITTVNLTLEQKGWVNLTIMLSTALCLSIYALFNSNVVNQFFDPYKKGVNWMIRQFGMGLVACLIAIPLVFALSQISDLVLESVFNIPQIEQTAVSNLRTLEVAPFLFFVTLSMVTTIVPMMEELLFRGFLQTWLMKYLSINTSIVITSLIFAGFHFASQQSWYNIQIVGALFILSLFLGYIYVRQGSLWAPIALHSLFNFIGVMGIFLKIS